MPSDNYNHFSDADLGAIVAYIRSIAAIDSALPANRDSPAGAGAVRHRPAAAPAGGQHRPHRAAAAAAARQASRPSTAQYLSETAGCPGCHGPGYSGGKVPQAPPDAVPAANITPAGLDQWTEADFLRAMRTGTRPDGRVLNTSMPWPYYAQMTDDELRAIWRYLQVLPRLPTGSR